MGGEGWRTDRKGMGRLAIGPVGQGQGRVG